MRTLVFISYLMLIGAWAATDLEEQAQFWHPDSFHSNYYLKANLAIAQSQGDSVSMRLIQGMQALKRKESNQAIEVLEAELNQDPALKPYLEMYLAQAYLLKADYPQTIELLKKASAGIKSSSGKEQIMKLWLTTLIQQGPLDLTKVRQDLKDHFNYDKKLQWDIEELLWPFYSSSQKKEAALYWIGAKDAQAQKFVRSLWSSSQRPIAIKDWSEDLWMDILEYDYNQVPKKFFNTLKQAPTKKFSKQNQKQLDAWKASCLYRTGQFAKASQLYKKLIRRNQGPLAYHHLQIARSYKKNNEISKSNYWYGQFRQKFPTHTKTAEMIWTQATKKEAAGQLSQADSLYEVIDQKFTKDKRRKWAKFKTALMYYEKKKWKQAVAKFDEAITQRRSLWAGNGAYFFKGDALYQLGRKGEAKESFLAAIADFPLSYYAHLSRQHLEDYQLMPTAEIPRLKPMIVSNEEAYAWVRQVMSHKSSDDSWSPQYQKTFERLLQIGAWDAADYLYASSPKSLRWRMDFVLKYSQLYLKYGYLAQSYRLARRLINKMSRKDFDEAPMQLYSVVFPKPHFEWIQQRVQGSQVDPLFVLSLMRQESIFNDQIFSPVGAAGLMQIMTYTGEPLAKAEGISKQYSHDLLRNPLMAIRLGSRYLVDLHKDWNGEYEYMLANYNAGPRPTKRWRRANKGLPKKIANEHITYWETRDYIKKVMGNYWNYQILEAYRTQP